MARVTGKYYRIEHSVYFGDGSTETVDIVDSYSIRDFLIDTYLKRPTFEPDYYEDVTLESLIFMVESIDKFEGMEVDINVREHTIITEGELLDDN